LIRSVFISNKNERLASGPGLVTKTFSVDISFNSLEVLNNKSLCISQPYSTLEEKDLIQPTRIGISKAKNIKWRWYLKNSRSVSKRIKGDRTPKYQKSYIFLSVMQIRPHKHIHTLANFSIKDYESVFELAKRFDALKNAGTKKIPALQGTLVTSLFFEASTRTKNSFELAAKRLSADVQTFAPSSSSLTKGETIIDTAITYSAMGADTLVIRHSSSYITFEIAKKLDAINSKTSVLNAGDGLHSHPSQGLLDIYTLIKFFSKESLSPEVLNSKRILIIGDVNHSRVARSNLWALSAFGADIILCGPKTLIPDEFINFLKTPAPNQIEDPIKSRGSITISRSLEESIKIADAIIVLRLQKERMMENLLSSIDSYSLDYGLTPEKLSLNNKEIPILHPGPINRDIEISSKVVDLYPNCLINNQVANGIPIRWLYFIYYRNTTNKFIAT